MARKLVRLSLVALAFMLALYTISRFQSAMAAGSMNNERGRKLYLQYCASCHGVDGKGNGPVAQTLKVPPPDLTAIPKKDGKFPGVHVRVVIEGEIGETELAAHGTREMPVWGRVFRQKRGDKGVAMLDAYALTKYIESIQQQ